MLSVIIPPVISGIRLQELEFSPNLYDEHHFHLLCYAIFRKRCIVYVLLLQLHGCETFGIYSNNNSIP